MNTLLRVINVIFLLHNTFTPVHLKEKIVRYSDPSLTHISSIQIDEFTGNISNVRAIAPFGNDSILVGAINFIAQLSLDLKQVKQIVPLEPTSNVIEESCWKADSVDECRNYIISIITLPDDKVYTCGTYALQQRCWTLDKDLNIVDQTSTLNYLSSKPQHDVTITRAGKNTFIGSKKIAISNIMGSSNTDFKNPSFVSSYLFEDSTYVYFFLREVAEIQSINDKRQYIYSYVARVCKFDNGHYIYSANDFVSLLKAQLVCKKKGPLVATYYDEIKTTLEVTIDNEKYIYGVFTTSSERGGDTAVCRYKVKDIMDTFEYSNILIKDGDELKTERMSSDRAFISRKNCNSSFSLHTQESNFKAVNERKSNILLADKVESVDQKEALFTLSSGTTSLAIDELIDSKGNKQLVYFFGTTDGFVYKLTVGDSDVTVLEKIQPFKEQNPINKVVVFKDFVYAAGPTGLTSFGVQRCENYMLCSDCVGDRDPYCSWKDSTCLASRTDAVSNDFKCPPAPNDLSCSITQINRGALRCSSPKAVAFHGWLLHSRKIGEPNDGFDVTSDAYKSTLVIRNLTTQSTGTYQCVIGNNLHRHSCTFELEAQNSTPKPLTTGTTISTTHTTISQQQSSTKPISEPTDITKIVTPHIAPTQKKQKDFFAAFLGTLILLLLILLVFLAYVLYKNCRSPKSPRAEENFKSTPTKTNGLSPIKKGEKYEVADNKKNKEVCIEMPETSLLLQNNEKEETIENGGTEKDNEEEKEASSPTVEEKDSLIVT